MRQKEEKKDYRNKWRRGRKRNKVTDTTPSSVIYWFGALFFADSSSDSMLAWLLLRDLLDMEIKQKHLRQRILSQYRVCHWKEPFLFDLLFYPICILFSCKSLKSLTRHFNISCNIVSWFSWFPFHEQLPFSFNPYFYCVQSVRWRCRECKVYFIKTRNEKRERLRRMKSATTKGSTKKK